MNDSKCNYFEYQPHQKECKLKEEMWDIILHFPDGVDLSTPTWNPTWDEFCSQVLGAKTCRRKENLDFETCVEEGYWQRFKTKGREPIDYRSVLK